MSIHEISTCMKERDRETHLYFDDFLKLMWWGWWWWWWMGMMALIILLFFFPVFSFLPLSLLSSTSWLWYDSYLIFSSFLNPPYSISLDFYSSSSFLFSLTFPLFLSNSISLLFPSFSKLKKIDFVCVLWLNSVLYPTKIARFQLKWPFCLCVS